MTWLWLDHTSVERVEESPDGGPSSTAFGNWVWLLYARTLRALVLAQL